MNRFLLIMICLLLVSCLKSQETPAPEAKLIGGPCEGCEAVFEYGSTKLTATDTLPGYAETKQPLKLSGTIYQPNGRTPAEDVILYIHHTNEKGIYPTRGDEEGWARRHGYLRGWVKTGKDGQYSFYTRLPGTYPDRSEPAHIHPFILEPGGKYYWVETLFFENDPLLTEDHIKNNSRGSSSGVLKLKKESKGFSAHKDFVLGKNIPDY